MTPTAIRVPPGRYGPEPSPSTRRRNVIAIWAVGVIGLAVVIWLGLGMSRTPVTWQDVGFRIDGDGAVEVTYDVVRPDPSVAVECRLPALNVGHAQVGVLDVHVPPAADTVVRLTTTIRTSEQAVTAVVESCRVAEAG